MVAPEFARHRFLHAGAHQGRVGLDQRHRLALHVRPHQRAVGVIVLQERNQRRRHRNELLRRDVDRGDVGRFHQPEIALPPHRHQVLGEPPFSVHRRIRLRDDKLFLLHRRQIARLALHLAVLDQHVRRLDEAVLVHLGVGGQRVDQADVRAFRRFDRADAAVMRRVHVAHLEAGALARQTARAKCRQAPLVRHFAQRVGLVHELDELRRAEEFAHRGRRRLGVDQVVRHHRVDVDRAHALANRPLHPQQADAILVLHQLADGTNAPVAEVVDVVDLAAPVLQVAQRLDRAQDVLLAQDAHGVGHLVGGDAQAHVHLHPADRGQVIAVAVEEQAAEQGLGGLRRRRLARAHHAVDVDQRAVAVGVLVDRQRVADPRAVLLVDRQGRQLGEAGVLDRGELGLGQFLAGLGEDLAGFDVDDILGDAAAEQVGAPDQHFLGLLGDFPSLARGEFCFRISNDLAGRGVDQGLQQFYPAERLGVERARPALRGAVEHHLGVEPGEDFFRVHAAQLVQLERFALGVARGAQGGRTGAVERVEQRGDRQLPLAVDADVDKVLAVELEIQPGAAIGDHPRREQILAGAVRLALVVVEEHAGRAVHLADDDAFGAIDDERAVVGHQRHVAHVDGLFLDVADRAGAGVLIHVPYDQAQDDLQRGGIGHAALDAFLDVVFRLLELVGDEFQAAAAREIIDREDRLEDFLQPGMQPAVGRDVHLQERLIAGALHVDKVRHRRHFGDSPEAAADAPVRGKRFGNRVHRLS